jgi:hypothetical protein
MRQMNNGGARMEYLRYGVWAIPLSEFIDQFKPRSLESLAKGRSLFSSWRAFQRWDGWSVLMMGGRADVLEVYVVQRSVWGYILVCLTRMTRVLRIPYVWWCVARHIRRERRKHAGHYMSLWQMRGFMKETAYSIISRRRGEDDE